MRRTKADAEETRQNIIDAAEHVFYNKGVSETSLEDVARAAGVTRGAIYWHFANKTELLLALHDCVPLPQEDLAMTALCGDPAGPLDVIERTCIKWLTEISRDQRRQRIYTILLRCDYTSEMASLLDRQRQLDATAKASVCQAFGHARETGQLAAGWTPEVAARCFVWMLKGLYVDWLRFGMQFDLVAEGTRCIRQLFQNFRETSSAQT